MVRLVVIIIAALLEAASGLAYLLKPRLGSRVHGVAGITLALGGILGFGASLLCLVQGGSVSLDRAWFLPWGSLSLGVDALGAFFLCLVFAIPALGAVYGLGYWKPQDHPEGSARLDVFYGLLGAAMVFVVLARDGVLFLMAWEVMALAAWFAATAEGDRPEVRRAGWIYLLATHLGTLFLFAMFALWRRATGSFALNPVLTLEAGKAGALFVLALVGFGFKAGLMPLHVWLPGAHANAPSHVSALMSGVMLKMGIYGLARMTSLMPSIEAWMAWTLLGVGALSGIAGIAFALGQKDLKRSLAYSSIENIGIIAMGLGLALLGRAKNNNELVLLGLGGALFHVWNHGLFKSLLFLDSGAVIHATGTRLVDRLGGLGKAMPLCGLAFVAGSLAICGLPPFNGFAGEWLVYLGFFAALGQGGGVEVAALGAVVLACMGALAVAAFVRLGAGVFLGQARSPAGAGAHDPGPLMLVPMAVLGLACLGLGLAPVLVLPLLESAVQAWAGYATLPSLEVLAPLGWLSVLGLGLLALLGLLVALGRFPSKARKAPKVGTWDCGYAQPSARMEYTATAFGQSLVGIFSFLLLPSRKETKVGGHFPAKASLVTKVPDPVLDRSLRPLVHKAGRQLPRFRLLQQGQTQMYILYILLIAIILLIAGGLGAAK